MSITTPEHCKTPLPVADCDFCSEFLGRADNSFSARYSGVIDKRILFDTPNFAVVPSLGQIVEGYLLIIPKQHFKALGDMTTSALEELSRLSCYVRQVLSSSYGTAVFFEHGTRTDGAGGCGIDHAHLHAVPIGANRDPIRVLIARHTYKRVNNFGQINAVVPDCSYLFYEDVAANRYVFNVAHLQSQYVRQLVAQSVGFEDWDWRKFDREKRFLSTLERLERYTQPAH